MFDGQTPDPVYVHGAHGAHYNLKFDICKIALCFVIYKTFSILVRIKYMIGFDVIENAGKLHTCV